MVDPSLMNVLDNFLNCDDTESLPFVNNFPKRQNSEILDEVIKELEAPQKLKTALLGSPDPDISDLSLEDLINIDSNVNPKTCNNADLFDSFLDGNFLKTNDDSLATAPFNLIVGDNATKESKSVNWIDTVENEAQGSLPVDFVIDSNNEVWSYIDCMHQSLAVPTNNEENKDDQNSIEDPTFSNFIDSLLVQCEAENIALSKETHNNLTISNENLIIPTENRTIPTENLTITTENLAISTESLPYYHTSDHHHAELIPNSTNYHSTSDSEMSSEASNEGTAIGMKRPLDESMHRIEIANTKRGKPSQEWNTIDHLIMDEEIDRETIKKIRNNEASRIHRVKKKEKFKDLFKRKVELEKSNAKLQMQVEVMQREADLLRDLLLAKMSSSTK